jgi:uncharacterized protein YPO0396
MRRKIGWFNTSWLLVLAASIFLWPLVAHTQDKPSAAETVENLKLQLIELSATEEGVKLRAQELDEAIKPENIERSLAGFGSTKPEELREQRRRQLASEKAVVTAHLESLRIQRSRLESALATAETNAYQESAQGISQNELSGSLGSIKWLVTFALLGVLALALVGAALFRLRFTTRISNR